MAPISKVSQPPQHARACGSPGVIDPVRCAPERSPNGSRWRLGVVLMLLVGTRLWAAPANDAFVNRIVISGSAIVTTGSNVGATKEASEPNHGGNAGGKSVWWIWTAPFSGGVTLTTAGSEFSTLVGVYTGTTVAGLTLIAGDGRQNLPGIVAFRAIAGVTYRIAVDGYNGASGAILLSLSLATSPANDNFASRAAIGGTGLATGLNIGATRETGETNHAGIIGGKSVWWTWTATSNSCVTISTEGSDFDTVLAVYTNTTLATLSQVAASDDQRRSFGSSVSFNAVAGRAYQIAVDGYNAAQGSVVLRVIPFAGPTNDHFANATVLSGTNISVVTSNLCATKEVGEPDHNSNPGGKSLWWEWTAPSAGGVVIKLDGTDFHPALAVYTGNSLATLTQIAGSLDHVVFRAIAGTKYRIAVDGSQVGSLPAESGTIGLQLLHWPRPANDDFSARLTLGASPANGSNAGATTEAGEPFHSQGIVPGPGLWGRSVWWTWTSTSNGPVSIATRSSNFVSVLQIYSGSALSNLTRLASGAGFNPTNELVFHAVSGASYQIAVDGVQGSVGNFQLSATRLGVPGNNDFAKRFILPGGNAFTNGWNVRATEEATEPNHAGVTGSNSVWWTWSTQTSGRLFLSSLGSSFSPALAVYQGTQINTLSPIDSGYFGQQCPRFSTLDFDLIVPTNCGLPPCSQTYQIAVDGANGDSGRVNLVAAFVPKPVNDQFASRLPLTGSFVTVTGSVAAASQEVGEVVEGLTNGLRTVWFNWVAPTTLGAGGGVTLRVTGIPFEPRVGVFQGNSLGTLTNVTSVIETKGNIKQVTFQAVAGAAYAIAVGGSQGVGSGHDSSFAQRRGATPPNALSEAGTFILRLNYSSLALRVRRTVPGSVTFLDFTRKVPFGAEAQIVNYGTQPSGTVRVRLVGVGSDGAAFGMQGGFLHLTSNAVPAGTTASIALNGACPPHAGVAAILEEELGGAWFFRDASVILAGLVSAEFLCITVTGGGVALLEPGLAGTCFCPPKLVNVAINGPATVTEGSSGSYWGTALFDNGSAPNFTNSVWTTSNTNRFPISTNGLLIAGSVTNNTPITVTTFFSYIGNVQSTNRSVTILNLPPPTLANPVRLADLTFQLAVTGVPGRLHVLEAATNLSPPSSWVPLATNAISPAGALIMVDRDATNHLRRFYRAREL